MPYLGTSKKSNHERDVCFIDNLPPELLSRIFELGSEKQINHRVIRWYSPFPLSLNFRVCVSRVSRHWRNIALSTPSLWTEIIVDSFSHPPFKRVTTLLDRSKTLPLDIHVIDNCFPHLDTDPGTKFTILFTKLIPHIHRWRTMRMTLYQFEVLSAFVEVFSDHSISAAPDLTAFQVRYSDLREEEEEGEEEEIDNTIFQRLTLLGGSAPLLTSIVLEGLVVDWDQSWIASACNLKELHLSNQGEACQLSWVQFSTILRGASSLEKLVLSYSGPSGDPTTWSSPHSNGPIPLSLVSVFELVGYSQSRAIGLLHRLYLPALKHLSIDLCEINVTEFVQELAGPATTIPQCPAREPACSLLSRLESFRIADQCHPDCIEMIYSELQSLTSLALSMRYRRGSFLDILGGPCTLPGRSNIWLPQLKALYINEAPPDAIRTFIQRRQALGAPVHALYMGEGVRADMPEDVLTWVEQNVKVARHFLRPVGFGLRGDDNLPGSNFMDG